MRFRFSPRGAGLFGVVGALVFFQGRMAAGALPQPPTVAPAVPAPTKQRIQAGKTRLEYDPLRTKFPLIYLSIGNSRPMPFMIDTGFNGGVFIEEKVAQQLNLPRRQGQSTSSDLGGVRTPLGIVTIDSLVAQGQGTRNIVLHAPVAYVGHLAFNEDVLLPIPVAGIIGMDILRQITLRLDFLEHTFEVITDNTLDFDTLPGTRSVTLPLTALSNGLYQVTWSPTLGGKPLPLTVDTGCEVTVLPPGALQSLAPRSAADVGAGSAFSLANKGTLQQTDQVRVGPFVLHNLEFLTSAAGITERMGIDVLSRFQVVLNFRRNKLTLIQTPQTEQPGNLLGTSPFLLRPEKGGFVIDRLQWDAPDMAQYRGWEIVSIDGQPVADMTPAGAQSLLNGYADTTATVQLKSKDKTVTVTVPRKSFFEIAASLPAISKSVAP